MRRIHPVHAWITRAAVILVANPHQGHHDGQGHSSGGARGRDEAATPSGQVARSRCDRSLAPRPSFRATFIQHILVPDPPGGFAMQIGGHADLCAGGGRVGQLGVGTHQDSRRRVNGV